MLPFKVMVANLIFGFANSVKINMHMLPHGILGWGCYHRKTGRGNGPFCSEIYVVQCSLITRKVSILENMLLHS